jgi:MYXO-CTERM domain-containing protein
VPHLRHTLSGLVGLSALSIAAAPAGAVTLALDDVIVIERGATGTLSATLSSDGASVAGVAATIRLASGLAPVLGDDGAPACVAGPATGKLVFANTRHEGGSHCTRQYDCNVLHLLVLSLTDTLAIPDGLLFSCALTVDPQVGIFSLPVRIVTASASDPAGALLDVAGVDGLVSVPVPPSITPFDTATPTPTWTSDPRPTATGDPGAIRSRKPTSPRRPTETPASAAVTPTPTATNTRSGGGGCAVSGNSGGTLQLMALALIGALARLRRRRERSPVLSMKLRGRDEGGRRGRSRRRLGRAGRSVRARAIGSRGRSRPRRRRGE